MFKLRQQALKGLASLLLIILLLPSLAIANHIKDDINLMDKAIRQMEDSRSQYLEWGIASIIADINECYESENTDKLYCFYLDHSARLMYAWGADEYWHDPVVQRAIDYIYEPNNISEENAMKHYAEFYDKLMERYRKLK